MPGLPYEFRVIFAEEFRRQIRNKGFMFFTALILIIMVGAIPITPLIVNLFQDGQEDSIASTIQGNTIDDRVSARGSGGPPSLRYGYVDSEGVLPEGSAWDAPPRRYASTDEGILAIKHGDIDTLFVLPADYIETGQIEDYWTTRDRGPLWATNWEAEGNFRAFLKDALVLGLDFPDRVQRAFDTGDFDQFDVPDEAISIEESGSNTAQGLVELAALLLFAFLLIIAVMTGSGSIIRSVSEEKETRMVEMLITSASPMSILTGKLLAVALAGLIHIAVWILVGAFATPAIFDRIPGAGALTISASSLVVVSFCFVLGYLLFSAFAMFVGTVVNSAAEGQRQMGLLSVLVGLPAWITGLVVNAPDLFLLQILTYVPFFTPTMLMVRIASGSDISNGEISIALTVVAVTAVLITWLASRVFSVSILLSGQSITSPRSLLAALRRSE